MLTYFDIITNEQLELTPITIIYLVKNNNHFSIKAISEGLEHLRADPTTRSTNYWLIDTNKLLNEQSDNPVIFIDNELTTRLLTSQQVQEFLGIDTNTMEPIAFDQHADVARRLHQQYAQHMDAFLADPNPSSEFFILVYSQQTRLFLQ